MKLNREKVLNELEVVQSGLSQKEILEQSSCFILRKGKVHTFNDEVSCVYSSCLAKSGIEGAVPSVPLLQLLQRMKEEEITVEQTKSQLVVKGKNKKAGIKFYKEVMLPIDIIPPTKQWRPIGKGFQEGASLVSACTSKDASKFVLTCIHITPTFVEACDRHQIARFETKTGFKGSALIRKESLLKVLEIEPTMYGETKSWVWFRNSSGVMIAVRISKDDYPDLNEILSTRGQPSVLPKGLGESIEKAEVFSVDNASNNSIKIHLKKNTILLRGEGELGWYEEKKRAKYQGKEISFSISPRLLKDIMSQHNECEITQNILRIATGKYVYATSLGEAH